MNLLSVENISRVYGERTLFRNVSFGLAEGDRVALIAKNGAGKSTLMNMLAGKDEPDTGKIVYRKDLRIGMLPQDPQFDSESS
ncbi:MAG TPA: ATP-binding cassette domain-containing protein, partial [Bacteroidia bacterium]|nr:ATP-binding cassette domain-containing protein [Bacteroidia bacterium]